jgi:hypothetical protein
MRARPRRPGDHAAIHARQNGFPISYAALLGLIPACQINSHCRRAWFSRAPEVRGARGSVMLSWPHLSEVLTDI